MRLSVVLGFAICFLLPIQSQAAWDIFQSYVILDNGSGDQYLAGGINAALSSEFNGTDLGDFAASDALTLNGGELKTYKNGSSNVCGGTLNYRVYASGDTPGAFSSINLPFSANLSGSDQKWAATGQGINLLNALTTGDYILEVYWEADGNDSNPSGCGETKYDSDSGNNFTASFSIVVPGCTDPAYVEYDAAATSDDGSCATLHDVLNSNSGVGYADIQTAIDAAAAGDAITLSATAFSPTGQLTLNKALSLTGAGSGSTTINGGGTGYAIAVTADNVHLEGFTLNGAASYGIKVSNSTTSIVQDLSMTDVTTDGTTRTGIDLNGVDGATLTNISGLNATGGFGLAIASSADITVNGLTTSGNAWGDAAIFPAATAYQMAGYEAPTDITFEGVLSLSSGTGALSVQDGALASGGTWIGSIANDAADNADITVPADFDGTVNATRNDGLSFHTVSPGAVAEGIAGSLTSATTPFSYSAISFQNLTSDEWAIFGNLTIQDAIDAASEGDFIEVDSGTYSEDLTIDKGLTLYGPNLGIAHDGARNAEAILDGEHTLSSTGTTTLDGLQFLNDDAGSVTTSLTITHAGDHTIQNNLFVSSVAGGNTGGTHDKGIYINSLASGSVTITENGFSGDGSFTDGDRYSTAPWGRGIWMSGGAGDITISENAFTNCRTGINLEAHDDTAHSIEDNTFTDCGSGMSLGNPTATAITSITGNRFQDVDTDLNLRNLTQAVEWNLATTDNLAIAGNSTFYSDLGLIPGNSAGDIDDPNGNMAFLSGDGEDRLTFGSDDNTITGDNAGAANDYVDGGDGLDRANYSDNQVDVTLTNDGDALIVASPTAGTDTLVNIEFLVLADATVALPIGCTDPDYTEYNADAVTDDGSCATLADPCAGALVLGSIDVDLSTTTLTSADGSATLTVTTGTPTSLTLTGLNGAGDYSFVQPGAIDGIAAGYYEVTAVDADGCNSDTLKLIMPYSLCCDCGVSDIDSDGICDDEDNCSNKLATNYNDPANGSCEGL